MENFGIICSVPAAFGMSMGYCAILAKVLRKFDRLHALLCAPSVVVLGMFVVETLLVLSRGVVGSRELIGPAFYSAHLLVFILGTPALANVLVLRPVFCKWYIAGVLCTVFAVFLVLWQYAVSEALYGINGTDGPYS